MNRKGKNKPASFAAMVREARTREDISQRRLGEQVGVFNTYIGQIEKGEKVPADEKCEKLARVLGLDPTELLLAAYEARAESRGSEEAKDLFTKMRRALSDPVAQQLLGVEAPLDPALLEALADVDIRGALAEESWRRVVARSYRRRKKRNILGLLALVESMNDKQWNAMVNMLEAMGLEAPD